MYVPMAVVAVINTRTAQLTQKYAPSVRAGKTCDDEWGKAVGRAQGNGKWIFSGLLFLLFFVSFLFSFSCFFLCFIITLIELVSECICVGFCVMVSTHNGNLINIHKHTLTERMWHKKKGERSGVGEIL